MLTIPNILLILAAIATALIAGLFYAYSCSVNPGLGRLRDAQYLAAMQSINRAILNPVFFMSFIGALLLLPVSAYIQYGQPVPGRFAFLLAAAIVYVIGVFGVTVLGNVPLNNQLDAFNLQSASLEETARQRAAFEGPWNKLNLVRTYAVILSLVLVILACVSPHKGSATPG